MTEQEDGMSVFEALTVLVVDDDPDILFAAARILGSEGHAVLEAATGEECLRMVREERPHLVLLDLVLPDIDGYEICKRIKEDPETAGVYVVLLSGQKKSSDDQSDGLEIGADGFIARPVPRRELLARLRPIIRFIRAELERDAVIEKLRATLSEVKTLKGLLPVCYNCKNVRKDDGYWERIDVYIVENSDAKISHGLCPECFRELFGTDDDEEEDDTARP